MELRSYNPLDSDLILVILSLYYRHHPQGVFTETGQKAYDALDVNNFNQLFEHSIEMAAYNLTMCQPAEFMRPIIYELCTPIPTVT